MRTVRVLDFDSPFGIECSGIIQYVRTIKLYHASNGDLTAVDEIHYCKKCKQQITVQRTYT